jgi:hypothetical protein
MEEIMSFVNMKKPDLLKLAVEDFGIEVPEKATVPQILALIGEMGVTWDMAVRDSEVAQKYSKAATPATVGATEPVREPEPQRAGAAVTTASLAQADDVVNEPTPAVITPLEREPEPTRPGATVTTQTLKNEVETIKEAPVAAPITAGKAVLPDKVLLKMNRENGTFTVRGYKFTKQHPYALVKADDAEYIVENIEGFYYASPKEAQEFYG